MGREIRMESCLLSVTQEIKSFQISSPCHLSGAHFASALLGRAELLLIPSLVKKC